MTQSFLTLRALPIALLTFCFACGDDAGPEQKAEPVEPRPYDEPPPIPADDKATGTGEDGAFAEGDWGEADTEATGGEPAGDEAAAAPEPLRHPGPCRVSWSGGARLRFTWDEAGGGTVKIDGDRDGKSDVCAKFTSADGRTTQVEIDDKCDKSFESKIVPAYEADSNLATAKHTETKNGSETAQDLTLIALPSFVGVAPGYPLWAAKDDVKLKTKKGLVTSATVKKPVEGPPVKVDFSYDADGRIKKVKEDIDADGTVDRTFDYRYDDAGNVTRVTLTIGATKAEQKKSTASFNYDCWKEKE